ncbi:MULTISPECIES: NADPH-dependent FMN reductase [unclassified Sedimentibacter]|uniref:NADPH-dependent FMN reductase n=1 Tax=unclassified Sedimentibacter TaxID=2649220 RepID=UPI0027E1F0A9|nr:NAD(P)H-dependent oxidoreductase [Sedimentibacter sp. MB35-C1]WMJ77597.1 NAD(P)H-dependent oxidoreductase [Sedimentibacter sp. MB35-C1]
MVKIAVILGSTKPGRNGKAVAEWIYKLAENRADAKFELVDIADYNLPLYDEPYPAMMQKYTKEHTKKWSQKIDEFDGYIFVTPEYNHSIPGALKNAIDFLNVEWKNKAVGFVSYGSVGGARAVDHLRQITGGLQMADIRAQVMLNLFTDFVNMSEFNPDPRHNDEVSELFNQLISWSEAMKTMRE